MKRLVSVISFVFICFATLIAQTSTISTDTAIVRLANRAFGLGFGREIHHVSYLSPLKYKGRTYEFWNETIKNQNRGKHDFYSIVNNRVHYSSLMPKSESSLINAMYDVFEFHKFYDLKVSSKFHLLCGAYAGFEIGLDMNLSNTNNPVYIRGDLNLIGLSVRPTMCLQSKSTHPRSKQRKIKVSDQFDFRLAGITFSPTYTQLYYDLTLPDYDKSEFFDLNSFSEKIRMSYKVMLEVPLRNRTLRVGMLAERSKSMINNIDNRTTNIQLLLGFSYDYYHIKGWLKKDDKFLTVFD